jgi:hypothetical protein
MKWSLPLVGARSRADLQLHARLEKAGSCHESERRCSLSADYSLLGFLLVFRGRGVRKVTTACWSCG